MKYEVEQKYRIGDLDSLRQVRAALVQRGAEFVAPQRQVDRYFAHPARNFAETDEALRLRCTDGSSRITYKGPKVGGPTKTRREIELPLVDEQGHSDQFAELLEALGFRPVAQVSKFRTTGHVDWLGRSVEVCLDEVEHVGSFIELELVVDPSELAEAQETVISLAAELGLRDEIRRSYLKMLLDALPGKSGG